MNKKPTKQPKADEIKALAEIVSAIHLLGWSERRRVLVAALMLSGEDIFAQAIKDAR